MSSPRRTYDIGASLYALLFGTALVCLPGFYLGFTDREIDPVVGSLVFGIAIFGAAFILSWAAEASQIDLPESLAVAILALVAVLPEYAVDFVFTWNAAHDPEQAHYAIANMTGANRLLVGLGWPLVLLLYVVVRNGKAIELAKSQRIEIFYLAMATIYSFTIPLKGALTLIDTVILVSLFAMYTKRIAGQAHTEPDIFGPVKIVANMKDTPRRISTGIMLAFAGIAIFFTAEPFAHSLVESGAKLGVSKFLLVQWLAPLASESPEFIIAATWTVRGATNAAIKALISSKVNQWTLLIGTIPLVYAISGGAIKPFVLDELQQHELLLTAAQSLFAVALLLNLRLSKFNGILLVVLFTAQLIVAEIRMEIAAVYLGLAVVYLVAHRKGLIPAMRAGLGIGKQ